MAGIFSHHDAGTGNYVGSLVGYLRDGTITGCYVEGGSVSGDEYVGGLVGSNGGEFDVGPPRRRTISNCGSTISVQGSRSVGGLVGENWDGSTTTSYSTGTVTGDRYVGGLVGYNDIGGDVIYCYSSSEVSGSDDVGGLVGYNHGGEAIVGYDDIIIVPPGKK